MPKFRFNFERHLSWFQKKKEIMQLEMARLIKGIDSLQTGRRALLLEKTKVSEGLSRELSYPWIEYLLGRDGFLNDQINKIKEQEKLLDEELSIAQKDFSDLMGKIKALEKLKEKKQDIFRQIQARKIQKELDHMAGQRKHLDDVD